LHTNSTRHPSSTLSSTTNNTQIPYIERVKRPSTLVKPVSILNKSSNNTHETPHTKNQVQFRQVKTSHTNSRPRQFLQRTNTQIQDDDDNNDDDNFPPPPPPPPPPSIPHHSSSRNTTLLKDYEEPIQNNHNTNNNKMQPTATVNVNVKLFPQSNVNSKAANNGIYSKVTNSNLFFNVEEEFKKKVFKASKIKFI
jgi:hypothetical protein